MKLSNDTNNIVNHRERIKLVRILITLFLIIYTVITIFPFYVLFIRTFVSTADSSELHLWIPPSQDFNMDARFGHMSVFYSLDSEDFKDKMGIEGYIDPNLTFKQLAENYNLSEEKIKNYMNPFFTFNGWVTVLKGSRFIRSLLATIFVTGSTMLLGGLLGISTGFVLAGFRKKWHFYAYNIYLLQIAIPPIMLMIPQFIIIKNLGLYNSYLALILFHIKGGALSVMLFTSFIAQIPKELREAVEIDGGGHFRYFYHILLPLCKVPFAAFAVIQAPWIWNDLLYPLLFLKAENYTLTAWLNSFTGGAFATNYQAIYSSLFLSFLPIFIVYFIFRKLFVRSIMAGAVKG